MLPWFDVDKDGLAALIQRRGAASAVVELVQNALDTAATKVKISLDATAPGLALLQVEDNDPLGFEDLAHAFTLFAPSVKKSDAEKRGRFNLGEKLVLALCDWAEIKSTKGTVTFSTEGRSESKKRRRQGSKFSAVIRLEEEDIVEVTDLLHRLLLPEGVEVSYNGDVIETRLPKASWVDTLPTEIASADGVLKPSRRKTTISIFTPHQGEQAHLYELGIPVVELDGGLHVNVAQKVPLNFERNNVTPSYLRALQVSVINNAVEVVTEEQAAAGWVSDALASDQISKEAVKIILQVKYDRPIDKLVRYDPTDPESRLEATSRGFTVIGGRGLTPDQWKSVNRAGLVPRAGAVTPSRNSTLRETENSNGTEEVKVVDAIDLTKLEQGTVRYVTDLASALLNQAVEVEVVRDKRRYGASYAHGRIRLNRTHLSKPWWADHLAVDELVLHECAHHYCDDHLSHEFYEATCRLGAVARWLPTDLSEYIDANVTIGTVKLKVEVD